MGKNTRVAVIMAGGSGERFWPLSRRHMPKQLLQLTDPERTLLQEAVNRVAPAFPLDHVYVQTTPHLTRAIRAAGLGMPEENVLAEPCKRNTAGCLVYAAAELMSRLGKDASEVTMAVVTADHMIGEAGRFGAAVDTAMAAAEQEEALVTIGILPTRPETGYGYIEIGADAEPIPMGKDQPAVFRVTRFREKPDTETAKAFCESGRFLWNSGMFFWTLSTFLSGLDKAAPAHAGAVREMADAMTADDRERVNALFEGLEDISIDYALLERAERVLVVRGDFPWDDIGAWDALDRSMPHDPDGNVNVGDAILLDTRRCVVYNAAGAPNMAVGVIGCEDLIVVTCDDGVLVAPRSRAQDVKRIVAELKERGAEQV